MSSTDDLRTIDSVMTEFREAWYKGENPDVGEYCRRNPDFGGELRARIENFILVAQRMPDLGKSPLARESDESTTVVEEAADPSLPFQRLGDFRLLREIGRGGMGVVYEAEQLSLNRKVALKVLPEHLSFSDEAVLKFRREAEAGGRQRHPGIVAIHDVGEHKSVHYIAQELVEGGVTLADRILEYREEKTLPFGYFRDCARTIRQAAEALQHAHDSGVIHRDVKPSNILLTGGDEPKISDFGLAKVEDALALTRTGDFAGTPYYMSPEQASSRKGAIDHRSDIFSLGVTFYELLTLSRPFEGGTSQEVLKKIISTEPMDPRQLNPRVPRDLAVICLKALEKEPNRRYSTMAELAGDLERYLAGEVILAKPAGAVTRVLKRVKRNPALSAAVAVAVIAVIALLISTPLYVIRLDRQRQAAEDAKADSDAINEFLVNMIESPDPGRDGREVTMVELLDKALARIEKDFHDRPLVAASVRTAIARTYQALGEYAEAKTLLGEALEIRKKLLGEEHPDTLDVMVLMVATLIGLNEIAEADALNRILLDLSLSTLGDNSVSARSALVNSGLILFHQDKPEEAEKVYRKLIDIQSRSLGPDHENTLLAMNNLGCTLRDQGKLKDAVNIFEEALRRGKSVLGEEHPETISSVANLAAVLHQMGRFKESEPLYRDLLKKSRITLGDAHPDTIKIMLSLGIVLKSMRRYAESETLLREAIASGQENLEDEHPVIINVLDALTSTLIDIGKLIEAEEINSKVLEIKSQVFGSDHPETCKTLDKRCIILSKLNRNDEAKELLEQLISNYSRLFGYEHSLTLSAENNLASVLGRLGHVSEAISLHRKVLDARRRILGSNHPSTANAMHRLSYLLLKHGYFEECESLTREMLDARRQIYGKEHPYTLSGLNKLAMVLDKVGKYDESENCYNEVIELRREALGEEHDDTLDSMNRLALLLEKEGELTESESLHRSILRIRDKVHGPDHASTIETRMNLARVLSALGKTDEAETMLKKCEEKAKESRALQEEA